MFSNICNTKKLVSSMILGLFILSLSSMLSGCGNKGDLYLPESGSSNDATNKLKKKN